MMTSGKLAIGYVKIAIGNQFKMAVATILNKTVYYIEFKRVIPSCNKMRFDNFMTLDIKWSNKIL